jgi:hypothetical protein
LVETSLTCLLIAIVLAAVFPTVPLFFGQSTIVQNTYAAIDQLVLASEVVTRYVHEAVAPAPNATPFSTAGANATTFYANTGNANGPEKVVAQVTNGAGGSRSFQLSLVPATASSCPPCTYGSATQSFVLINYLTNGTGGSPIFTYTLQGGGTCAGPPPGSGGTKLTAPLAQGTAYTTLTVQALTTSVSSGDGVVIGTGPTTQTVTASSGAAVGATSIPVTSFVANAAYATNTPVFDNVCTSAQVAQITAVSINLQATKTPGGQPTGYQTLAYLFSPAYNAAVG